MPSGSDGDRSFVNDPMMYRSIVVHYNIGNSVVHVGYPLDI